MRRWLNKLKYRNVAELEHLQHFLGFRIDLDNVMLKSGNLGYVVVSAFAFLFLKLDGDATNLAVTKSLHQVCDESADKNKTNVLELIHADIDKECIIVA